MTKFGAVFKCNRRQSASQLIYAHIEQGAGQNQNKGPVKAKLLKGRIYIKAEGIYPECQGWQFHAESLPSDRTKGQELAVDTRQNLEK